jgi:hypothetical protein
MVTLLTMVAQLPPPGDGRRSVPKEHSMPTHGLRIALVSVIGTLALL